MADILNEKLGIPEVKKHPYVCTPMDEVVSKKHEPLQKLVGDFIYSEELTLFYGLSGLGKSMFAVQMGLAISEGQDLDLGNDIVLENQCEPMKVMYFDLELSERQFYSRVKGLKGYSNFIYCNVKRGEAIPSKNPISVFEQMKNASKDFGAKCIIIDNISRVSGDIEKSEPAKEFMDACLKLVKGEKYNIIIVAHITKKEPFITITKNDLRGSGILYDLSDSALSIGKANRVNTEKKGEVYLIQMKTRSDKYFYDNQSVIHCIQNKENDFLKLDAIGLEKENDLLLEDVSINTERARYRIFYTIACLYYGNHRNASAKLKSVKIVASSSTIYDNAIKFEKEDSLNYNKWKGWDKNQQKELLDSQSSYSFIELPYADGHNETPF